MLTKPVAVTLPCGEREERAGRSLGPGVEGGLLSGEIHRRPVLIPGDEQHAGGGQRGDIGRCPAGLEAVLAERRARAWWQLNQTRFGTQTPYLAVQTNLLLQGEIVQNLYEKMIKAKTTSLFFAQGLDRFPVFTIYGVVVFDTRTNRLVSPQGYAVVDTPHRGRIARFGPYIARYIGTGK